MGGPVNSSGGAETKPKCSWPFNAAQQSPVSPVWTSLFNGLKLVVLLSVAFVVLLLAIVWLVNKAFTLPEASFYHDLCVVSASGIATFLGTPIIIKASAKHRWTVAPPMLLLAAACVVLAFLKAGTVRALLIEAAVAILLIIALELIFHQFIHVLHARYEDAQKELEEEREWNEDFPFGPPRRPRG
jgi:hypothetical protein